MNQMENERATAHELVSFARERGLDLEPFRNDSMFQVNRRWIFLWRKRAGLHCSGSAEEEDGTLHYNMQGAISVLPSSLKGAAGVFQGAWSEAGTFENVEQALDLVKAWLIETKEVDDLPKRHVGREGIG